MKIAHSDGKIYIQCSKEEYPIVKGLPNAKFDKKTEAWVIPKTLDMLERLKRFIKLPEPLESERQRLKRKQSLIDAERMKENPIPVTKYPVKVNLFKHQVKAANMAMLAFEMYG